MTSSITISIPCVGLTAALAFASTGGALAHGPEGPATAAGKPGEASDVARTVDVAMKDTFYEPDAVTVSEGETIRFTVTNEGALVHEFNIGTAQMHAAHQREMQKMMQTGALTASEIHPDKMRKGMKHDDPNSVLLEPGETAEVIWTFTESGEVEFACNVPGHYEGGMVGEVTFEEEVASTE